MNPDIYIGIDMGSTGLKAVAFDGESGWSLAASGAALPFIHLPGGGCELGAEAIEGALMQALRSVASQLGPRVAAVRALSCTGHGAGLYALDARHRLLRARAVASIDQRASARARALAQQLGAQLFEEVGCRPWSGQPTLIAAELLATGAMRRGAVHRLLFAKDYLGLLLTGEPSTDASDVGTAGLLALDTGACSMRAFDAAGLSELAGTLAPIVPGGAVIGTLLPERAGSCGLPAGLPVAASAIDLLASLMAVGAPQRGQAVAVLGTWCVNAVIDSVREPKPAVGAIVNFGVAGQRLYLENSPSSMANVAWLARTLGLHGAAQLLDCALSVPLGAQGLRFLPFINGGSVPEGVAAGFIGLRPQHGRAHMARAVVDAVAALHARHLGRLASCGLGVRTRVAALGGGARDVRLVRLIASFLGHPVARCGDDETGARGAALYAAMSQGASMPAPSFERVAHDAQDADACADYYGGFLKLVESMPPVCAHIAEPGQ
ncbi:carbohydrate kinase [Verminephrobacter aporrectodeae subsp. tuberculatae]|uniref:FGGY family carbohydrate kinase n=1 Tax=Verminephrobacter aporrectodeae TaxID=1110389 RepID=UPI0022382322|nr:FGGY family carbohydrate kinase [Verminephrobacter aporrectodeae]MCW5221352.1 carbohydrate kinase [Verminephrobacter aporrectodeae subsp. tuberculatae]MCW5290643.1 carbohydrate kinase [Verminephrobacter aporrectodeae subsp. tuberculatae]